MAASLQGSEVIYVNGAAASGGSGASWSSACSTLQAALAIAPSGAEVWVAGGTYVPTTGTARTATFTVPSGVVVRGGFTGTETTSAQRTLGATTILSGDIGTLGVSSDNCYHVVTAGGQVTLDRLIITGGNANVLLGPNGSGGGLLLSAGTATLINCVFANNSAIVDGGALSATSCALTLENAIFLGNSATVSGGAMAMQGGSLLCHHGTCTGNSALVSGGALFASGVSTVQFLDSILWNDSSLLGAEVTAASSPGPNGWSHCDVTTSITGPGVSLSGSSFADFGGNIAVDPQFTAPTSGPGLDGIWLTGDDGLRLQPGSACIDSGADATIPDILFVPRPQGSAPDMGAYESPVVVTVTTANGDATEAHPGTFLIARTGALTASCTVGLVFGGTAVNGTDYIGVAQSAVLPAGSNSTVITISPLVRQLVEPALTVSLGVLTGTGYEAGTPASSQLVIADQPPLLTGSGTPAAWVQGQMPVRIDGGITVVATDTPDFAGGLLTVAITAGEADGDVLSIANQGTGLGQIGLSADAISYNGLVIGSLSATDDELTIYLTNAATASAVQTLLRNVYFASGDDPGAAVRTVTILLYDGAGAVTAPLLETIDVTPVDQPPVVQPLSLITAAGTAVNGQLVAVDPDSPVVTFAVVTAPQKGVLTLNPATGALVYTPAAMEVGGDAFSVVANDGQLDSQVLVVPVSISNPADPHPLIASPQAFQATVGVALHQLVSVDASLLGGAASCTFALVGTPPSGVTLTTTAATQAVIDWTPQSGDVGDAAITVLVVDTISGTACADPMVIVVQAVPGGSG